ncbi:MAG TPA: hypothetical protein VFN40_12395 [Gemmatimonadales bacterium]|nr:hypothetical protein [Gemmatimonadales bacterium]
MNDGPPESSLAGRLGRACLGGALIGIAGWLTLRNLGLTALSGWIFWVPVTLWLSTMGLLCLWSAVSGEVPASRTSIQASWRAGWIAGGIGLGIGFVGPLVLWPKSNLGPLLGLLLTGPLGFVLGALGAGVVRVVQRARPP